MVSEAIVLSVPYQTQH